MLKTWSIDFRLPNTRGRCPVTSSPSIATRLLWRWAPGAIPGLPRLPRAILAACQVSETLPSSLFLFDVFKRKWSDPKHLGSQQELRLKPSTGPAILFQRTSTKDNPASKSGFEETLLTPGPTFRFPGSSKYSMLGLSSKDWRALQLPYLLLASLELPSK